jgi:hypothetical protein
MRHGTNWMTTQHVWGHRPADALGRSDGVVCIATVSLSKINV